MNVSATQDGAAANAHSTWVKGWAQRAICSEGEPDALFVKGFAQHAAKKVCQRCPVISDCLADSLDNRTRYGVWGGMTEHQRRVLLTRRPEVVSWRALFEADRIRRQQHAS